jgi:hypothetical protein
MKKDEPFKVVDTSGLTDADWSEINKIQQAYKGRSESLEQGDGSSCKGSDPLHCSYRGIFSQYAS